MYMYIIILVYSLSEYIHVYMLLCNYIHIMRVNVSDGMSILIKTCTCMNTTCFYMCTVATYMYLYAWAVVRVSQLIEHLPIECRGSWV